MVYMSVAFGKILYTVILFSTVEFVTLIGLKVLIIFP